MRNRGLGARLAGWLFHELVDRVVMVRCPDYIIGATNPMGEYLNRWYLTPWRSWYRGVAISARTRWHRIAIGASRMLPSPYLHEFVRDDDARALHDHPSFGVSFMLKGSYIEHTIAAGGIHRQRLVSAGTLRFFTLFHAHRIELLRDEAGAPIPCWTLFMFGPVLRNWGFHCPERGWVPWEEFTAEGQPGEIGPGCGD